MLDFFIKHMARLLTRVLDYSGNIPIVLPLESEVSYLGYTSRAWDPRSLQIGPLYFSFCID